MANLFANSGDPDQTPHSADYNGLKSCWVGNSADIDQELHSVAFDRVMFVCVEVLQPCQLSRAKRGQFT